MNDTPPADIVDLSIEQCYEHLGETGIGRVAVCTPDGPVILPVNYLLDGESLLIRTAPYTLLADYAISTMAVEVDELEPALKRGWSVLIVGHAMPVEDPAESVDLRSSGRLEAWAPGPRNLFIRITPRRVTGRQIGGPPFG
jgi:uncharacterized protein